MKEIDNGKQDTPDSTTELKPEAAIDSKETDAVPPSEIGNESKQEVPDAEAAESIRNESVESGEAALPEIESPADAAIQETDNESDSKNQLTESDTPCKPISEMSNAEKGYLGEALTAEAMQREGYEPMGSHIKPQGIDSVWMKDDNIVLVETKFRSDGELHSADLKDTAVGQQGSMEWTFMRDNENQDSRFREACGERTQEVLDKMIENGYATRVAVVDGEGALNFRDVDTQARGWAACESGDHDTGKVQLAPKSEVAPDSDDRTRSYFH